MQHDSVRLLCCSSMKKEGCFGVAKIASRYGLASISLLKRPYNKYYQCSKVVRFPLGTLFIDISKCIFHRLPPLLPAFLNVNLPFEQPVGLSRANPHEKRKLGLPLQAKAPKLSGNEWRHRSEMSALGKDVPTWMLVQWTILV